MPDSLGFWAQSEQTICPSTPSQYLYWITKKQKTQCPLLMLCKCWFIFCFPTWIMNNFVLFFFFLWWSSKIICLYLLSKWKYVKYMNLLRCFALFYMFLNPDTWEAAAHDCTTWCVSLHKGAAACKAFGKNSSRTVETG